MLMAGLSSGRHGRLMGRIIVRAEWPLADLPLLIQFSPALLSCRASFPLVLSLSVPCSAFLPWWFQRVVFICPALLFLFDVHGYPFITPDQLFFGSTEGAHDRL